MISSIDIIPRDSRPREFEPHHSASLDSGRDDRFAQQLVRARDEQSTRDSSTRAAADARRASATDAPASEPKDIPAGKSPDSNEKNGSRESSTTADNTKTLGPAERATEEKSDARESAADDTNTVRSRKENPTVRDSVRASAAGLKSESEGGEPPDEAALVSSAALASTSGSRSGSGEEAEEPSAAEGELKSRRTSGGGGAPVATALLAAAVGGESGSRTIAEAVHRQHGASEKKASREIRFEVGTGGAAKKREGDSKPALEIVDLRRERRMALAEGRSENLENRETQGSPREKNFSIELDRQSRQELMVLESSGGREEGVSRTAGTASSRAAGELARALREGGNEEILKRAQFLLKDNDKGEIRLILKPERLGEVRIRLNLSDRHIAGRIIVENSSVRDAFTENMEALNRAFRENGFQTAGLEVSVGGREGSPEQQRGKSLAGRRVDQKGLELLDEQVPRLESDVYATSRVNVYV